VELLSRKTKMMMRLATNGSRIQPNCVYIIPPGVYLGINGGLLRYEIPKDRQRIHLPLDYFLRTLAESCGDQSGCVILSGSGADGSLGIRAIKQYGGLVIAQQPEEATYDGMPRSAIETGLVDAVLPILDIPARLQSLFEQQIAKNGSRLSKEIYSVSTSELVDIIDLLRVQTGYDFDLYKTGTLTRRLERRMAFNNILDLDNYLILLRESKTEAQALVDDLLINVTSFFRDAAAFEYLEKNVIPELINNLADDRHIRIWVPGCSSGEEVYSLVILFQDYAAQVKKAITLQVFATDIDQDALTTARSGAYSASIAAEVSPERLAKYFIRTEKGYQISNALRQPITFTEHNLLSDPPFSRLQLVVCRNLLIYLKPEIQEKVFSLFHFSIADSGYIFLGPSENLGGMSERFETISAQYRIFKLSGSKKPAVYNMVGIGGATGNDGRATRRLAAKKPISLEALAHEAAYKEFAHTSVLINGQRNAVFFSGQIDRYLKLNDGNIDFNIPTMSRENIGHQIRVAIQLAEKSQRLVSVIGDLVGVDGIISNIEIKCYPVLGYYEPLLMLTFSDIPETTHSPKTPLLDGEVSALNLSERNLQGVRKELEDLLGDREEDRETISTLHEEYLSMKEEYQATNEELETSKEELQSTNEELVTLNSHLKQTLDAQHAIAADLQNILSSSELATVFLDKKLNVRFFTPPVQLLMNVRESDIGRPLSELRWQIEDNSLLEDTVNVLNNHEPILRDIKSAYGFWYHRKVLPYFINSGQVDGVVITLTDITEIKKAELAARQASNSKSLFLSTMSHELRTPLNAVLGFAEVLKDKALSGCHNEGCIESVEYIIAGGKHLLSLINDILDVSKIETGKVSMNRELISLSQFGDSVFHIINARAIRKNIKLVDKVDVDAEFVFVDSRALKQIMYNLLANAVEYTPDGGRITVFVESVGGGGIDISVIDTGCGIPADKLDRLMRPFEQVDNSYSRRHGGSGLGLFLVKCLTEANGGRFTLESIVGSGTKATVHFPPMPASYPDVGIDPEVSYKLFEPPSNST
ncbi:MAG: PAS domain-containing protein, partial [Candidatus Omnitrophica bacterium]|nr:PAS domain-containing protein [Candidatus Omnitrophota bacterium]